MTLHVLFTPDKLKHWQVLAVQCGAISPGSRMFLALTGYALVLLHDHSIVAYHDLLENDFGICYEESNILHIAVTSKVQSEEENLQSSKCFWTQITVKNIKVEGL